VHERAVGGLTDGTGSRSGNPHRRTLPQLLRFGTNVAQKGFNVLGICNFKELRVAEIAHLTTLA
jgi:hypothetical protein